MPPWVGARCCCTLGLLSTIDRDDLLAAMAHLAELIDRVFAPEVDSETQHGADKPWP